MDTVNEYEHCAEMCAARGLQGKAGDMLPNAISIECFEEINADLDAFQKRVSEYAYGQAMARVNLPEDA